MNDKIVNGIITFSGDVGESDKRIVILTKELGRISAFVKYARKSKSRFIGTTREFISAKFHIYRSGDSYTVMDIEVNNYFENLIENIDRLLYGYYFLEVINYFTRENNDEKESLYLLYRTLQQLEENNLEPRVIKAIFEFKILVLQGEYPYFGEYIDTKEALDEKDYYNFSVNYNGIVKKGGTLISRSTLNAMQFIIRQGTKDVYNFRLKDYEEFIKIVDKYFSSKVEHNFKTLSFIKR